MTSGVLKSFSLFTFQFFTFLLFAFFAVLQFSIFAVWVAVGVSEDPPPPLQQQHGSVAQHPSLPLSLHQQLTRRRVAASPVKCR